MPGGREEFRLVSVSLNLWMESYTGRHDQDWSLSHQYINTPRPQELLFEEELTAPDPEVSPKTRRERMTDYLVSLCSSSYKGLLLLCMLIFSVSMIYNLIQIFLTLFS